MKKSQLFILTFLVPALFLVSCKKDEDTPKPTSEFTFVVDGNQITFTSDVTNANTYLWDFGDDVTSTEPNPVHTYAETGTYTVTLTVIGNGGEAAISHDVEALTLYRQPSAASRTEIVLIPEGLEAKAESDMGAMLAVTYMSLANGISQFGTSFALPEDALVDGKKGGSTVYHWSYGGYSYWMTYEEQATKYTWTYDWEFPNQPRFTYISAEEAKDGKSGNWKIFDFETTSDYVWTYNWSIDASETFAATLLWNDSGEVGSFNVISRKDNSGSFTYKIGSVLHAEVIWNANGSGTYWIYGDGGDDLSGSWTAK